MNWADIVQPSRIHCAARAQNRREAIGQISDLLAPDAGGDAEALLDLFLAREKLGSTAIGQGVLLPHAKSESIPAPVAAMLVLEQPLDCATPDDVPVDVVMGFLVPGNDLPLLAGLVKQLRDGSLLRALRSAGDPEEAYAVLRRAAG